MNFLKRLMLPIAYLYGFIIYIRNLCYDKLYFKSYTSSLPVISVGNVTAGGSGKTPFCAYLAKSLYRNGHKPVILSRGYKGSVQGPHLVNEEDDAKYVGDEPKMFSHSLKEECKVVVSKKRSFGAHYISSKNLGSIIVLDDGFQHRALKRDLDIVLVDASSNESLKEVFDGELLPVGRLREQPKLAFKRADVILFVKKCVAKNKELCEGSDRKQYADFLRKINYFKPFFEVGIYPQTFYDVYSGAVVNLEEFRGKVGRAITGIAVPQSFFSLLKGTGIKLEREFKYPDHHYFLESDWVRAVKSFSGPIFTTMKDAVKLNKFVSSPGLLFSLSLAVQFADSNQEEEFWGIVNNACPYSRESQITKQFHC
jgi:tetraacyldisaccharide 4'-kinase